MAEERCWICGRNREELTRDMPPGFWDENIGFFRQVEVLGKIASVDRVKPGDPSYSKHFQRKEGPSDEICSFDDHRWAIVMRKRRLVNLCRVCHATQMSLHLIDDVKETPPRRPIYSSKIEENHVVKTWEKMQQEDNRLEKEFPEDSYRVLSTLIKCDLSKPLTLWDLSNFMRVFNHRNLESPVLHILKQEPNLASYDQKAMKLIFSDPESSRNHVTHLLQRYENFYNRDVRTAEQEEDHQKIMSRIRILEANTSNRGGSRW